MPQNEAGWDLVSIHSERTFVMKLYVLVVFASFLVAAIHLVRFWRTARTLRRSESNLRLTDLQPLRNRAHSLKQWILLDSLAWSIATAYSFGNVVKGGHGQGVIGMSLMLDVFWELCQPLILLLWTVLMLFLARWHLLWRIERLEMEIN